MSDTRPEVEQPGLSRDELTAQEAHDLPDRDAMSLLGHVDLGIGVPIPVDVPTEPVIGAPVVVAEAPGIVPVDVGEVLPSPLDTPVDVATETTQPLDEQTV